MDKDRDRVWETKTDRQTLAVSGRSAQRHPAGQHLLALGSSVSLGTCPAVQGNCPFTHRQAEAGRREMTGPPWPGRAEPRIQALQCHVQASGPASGSVGMGRGRVAGQQGWGTSVGHCHRLSLCVSSSAWPLDPCSGAQAAYGTIFPPGEGCRVHSGKPLVPGGPRRGTGKCCQFLKCEWSWGLVGNQRSLSGGGGIKAGSFDKGREMEAEAGGGDVCHGCRVLAFPGP